jgi:predicted RNA-binding Zn-ribbon protein involved in translation (DUF1610 family)
MQAPDPIETILARLMPAALSEHCQTDIEKMVSELAGAPPENVVAISSGKWIVRSLIGGSIAAAIGAMCAIFPLIHRPSGITAAQIPDSASPAGFVLVSESDRIESVTDEGWLKDSEGSPMHSVRLKTVQENKVRDEQSGMVVQISEPREEILMMPAGSPDGGPTLKKPLPSEMVEAATVPEAGSCPVRMVNFAEKSASFSCPSEGKAVVSREDGSYQVSIHNSKGEVIFERKLPKDDSLEQLPEMWRKKVQILCRTLDQALDGGMMPKRQPQARVAPPDPHEP